MNSKKTGNNNNERRKKKWVSGKEYICTHSASPGYKVGDVYKCHENDDGNSCLTARDGYVDLCVMIVIEFKGV